MTENFVNVLCDAYMRVTSRVTGTPYAGCYLTVPRLFGGWTDGLEWSTGCAASDPVSLSALFLSGHIV